MIDPAATEPVLVGAIRAPGRLPGEGEDAHYVGLDEGGRRKVMSGALSGGQLLSLLRRADLLFRAGGEPVPRAATPHAKWGTTMWLPHGSHKPGATTFKDLKGEI